MVPSVTCVIMSSTVDLRMLILYLLKIYQFPLVFSVSLKVKSLSNHFFFPVYRANVNNCTLYVMPFWSVKSLKICLMTLQQFYIPEFLLRPLAECWGFPHSSVGKESTCSVEDSGSISGWGRSSGEENGNPLQYSCQENPEEPGRLQSMGSQESYMT